MDPGALPVAGLAGALYRRFEGRPAIVVGGGPSAPVQFERASKALPDALVLSANGHAAKLGVAPAYVVCKDHLHTETRQPMEPALRALGAPVVARHYWADLRVTSWPIQGNSGMMALGFAVMLGCRPVVPVGFDCYQGGTYFHDAASRNVSGGLSPAIWHMRYVRLARRLEGAPVRVFEGPLRGPFPLFDPTERFGRPHMPVALQQYANCEPVWVRALASFSLPCDRTVTIPAGYVFPADRVEIQPALRANHVALLDNPPGPVVLSHA